MAFILIVVLSLSTCDVSSVGSTSIITTAERSKLNGIDKGGTDYYYRRYAAGAVMNTGNETISWY